MRWTPVLLLAMVAFAGCADEAPPEAADETFEDFDATTAAGTGVIRGVVVDPTITPIADATVTIKSTQESTETNEDGAFVFKDIEPGTYFLDVTKVGYEAVQQNAQVEADVADPPVIRIQLIPAPGTEPSAMTFQDTGVIGCGWGIPITYGYCGDEIGFEDDPSLDYYISGTPDYIQVEIIWESTQPASENLYMIQAVCPPENEESCPGALSAGSRWDEGTYSSPAIMRTPEGFLQGALTDFGHESMDQWILGVDVSADGPALATGVTVDQQFTGYVTMFWNITPDEDWTFHEDGEYEY